MSNFIDGNSYALDDSHSDDNYSFNQNFEKMKAFEQFKAADKQILNDFKKDAKIRALSRDVTSLKDLISQKDSNSSYNTLSDQIAPEIEKVIETSEIFNPESHSVSNKEIKHLMISSTHVLKTLTSTLSKHNLEEVYEQHRNAMSVELSGGAKWIGFRYLGTDTHQAIVFKLTQLGMTNPGEKNQLAQIRKLYMDKKNSSDYYWNNDTLAWIFDKLIRSTNSSPNVEAILNKLKNTFLKLEHSLDYDGLSAWYTNLNKNWAASTRPQSDCDCRRYPRRRSPPP